MVSQSSRVAAVMSTSAAVMAALAWAASAKGVSAAQVPIPKELMDLVVAIALSEENVDANTLAIIEAINALKTGGTFQGWPPNVDGTRTFAVLCPVAARAYPVPDMVIPDGMSLLIKASPINVPLSLVFVGRTPAECTNPNSSWPLVPNESVTYAVKNASGFYISTDTAGSIAIFTAEQRG